MKITLYAKVSELGTGARVLRKSHVSELAEQIRESGEVHPIVLQKLRTGYHLVDGAHRVAAAKELKIPYIPVVIHEP